MAHDLYGLPGGMQEFVVQSADASKLRVVQ